MKLLQNIWVQAAIVFLVALIQYSNTANHAYAWDDAIVLTENTRVQKGLKDIPELFENIKTNETQNRYGYRPIALLSFATDVQFFGMDPKPAHRVNILLYGLLCVLVLFFIRKVFNSDAVSRLLVVLIFAVHPIHTEVVANIKSRDEILALGFGLLSLMFYANFLSGKKTVSMVASVVFMVLGFLSKESAITFVGTAFFLPWFMQEGVGHAAKLKKGLPLIGFIALLLLIRFVVYSDWFFQSNDFELQEKGLFVEDGYVGNPLFAADFADRVATAVFLVPYFVYRFLVPYPLLHDYSFDQFAVQSFSSPLVWASIVGLCALVAVAIIGTFKRQPYGFGLLFFIITCSIFLHLVQIAPDIFAERFLFAPSLGLCIALLSFIRLPKVKKYTGLLFLILVPMFGYSWDRNKTWKNNQTLLEDDLPRLENCVRANYNYALFLHSKYYSLPAERQAEAREEILRYYEHTMELTDRLFNVYFDLGAAYMEFGKPQKGYDIFLKASQKYPDVSLPFVQLGKYYMSFKEYARAIPYFKRAMKNGAKNSDYHYLMAVCLFNSGWYTEAIETLIEGEKLGVSSSAYHSLMGRLYANLLDYENAEIALKRGLKLYPNDSGLLQMLNSIDSARQAQNSQ